MRDNKGNSVTARSTKTATASSSNPDVVLIGAGIMSATLAVILKESRQPELMKIVHSNALN
jgi:phosphotransferase system  glucose/maltose/N-acetylglucosamine-specific IIC component